MKKTVAVVWNVLGWLVTIFCVAVFILSAFSFYTAKKSGKPVTVLGYRPVYILTGSMEPAMKPHGIVVTKELGEQDEIRKGDIITYHMVEEDGKTIVITHRVYSIGEDGGIITKGDNNRVVDSIPLTRDQIDAKVVFIFNEMAFLIRMWDSISGKIAILFIGVGSILLVKIITNYVQVKE